jgi:hypothetical protein
MPWPRGRAPTWDVERLEDDVPCPAGDVGEFTRGSNGKRKCRACQRRRMKRKRAAAARIAS